MNRPRPLLPHSLAVALFAAAGAVLAQGMAPPPPQLEPLPEIPPPPELAGDPELGPQVTITRKEGETVEEARVNGRVVWIRVTPRHGKSYFLIPDTGGTMFVRRDSLDSGLKVPLWLLLEF
jgi:Protein of unknown function (DUF2782)